MTVPLGTPLGWQRVRELFHSALERDPATRGDYLDQACAGDADLRREVDSLIAAHGQVGSFIAEPVGTPQHPASSPIPPGPSLPTGSKIGPYELIELLGSGGMGEVYRARDPRLGRDVALKVLPPHVATDPDRRQRFLHEARMISALNHPNICTIYEVGSADGRDYICFEFIEGQTLAALLEGPALSFDRMLELALPLADALAYAHEKGILHRDLKPANIMVSERGPKILDFGLAKVFAAGESVRDSTPSLTDSGLVVGTAAYMSPEQALGRKVDERSDIFSLGTVLYEMASGKPAFVGSTPTAVIDAVLHQEPVPLVNLRPELPAEFPQVVQKALRKDASERYQRMADLATDLRRLGAGIHTVIAGRRQRILRTGIVAAVAVSMLVGLVLFKGWRARPRTSRIVVLPFQNLGAPEDAYFAAGLTEEVIGRLTNLQGLSVISRMTALGYDRKGKTIGQIANDLGVDYVLEGTVSWDREAGRESRVRVAPALTQAADGTQIWASRYDRVLADVFAIQSEVAENVVSAMGVKLVPRERAALRAVSTTDMEAYDFYLRGLEYNNRGIAKEDMEGALRMFQAAVDRDPRFTQALAQLAMVHASLYFYHWDRSREHVDRAGNAVDRLGALGPDLAETHTARGYYLYHGLGDYPKALDEFKAALDLQPGGSDALAGITWVLRRKGRWQESAEQSAKLLENDPRSPNALFQHGLTCVLLRRYAEADRVTALATSFSPEFANAWAWRVRIQLLWHGDVDKAHSLLSEAGQVPRLNDAAGLLAYEAFKIAVIRRDFRGALRLLEGEKREAFFNQFFHQPIELLRGEAHRLSGENQLARISFEASRRRLQELIAKEPDDSRYYSALGIACAGLSLRKEALDAATRGTELMPSSKDSWRAMWRIQDLALVHSMLGQQDEAIDRLDFLLSHTGEISTQILQLDPRWETLNSNPRFQALLRRYRTPP